MVTKRQLGIFVIALGFLVAVSTTAVDFVGAGQWGGFGPLQQIGISLGLATTVVGLILVRLGNRPA